MFSTGAKGCDDAEKAYVHKKFGKKRWHIAVLEPGDEFKAKPGQPCAGFHMYV